jgi:ribosomal protein L16 Arg81 hydroxylase
MKFEQFLAPVTRDVFFCDYWEQNLLHQPGAPGRFAQLFDWEALNQLMNNHWLTWPHIKLSQNGRALEPDRFLNAPPGRGTVSRPDPGRLVSLLAGGATLILNTIDEIHPGMRELAECFRDAVRARSHVNLYAGWHAQNGFDLHWDAEEIFILQISGRKRWQAHKPTRPYSLNRQDTPKPSGKPDWEGVLEDGDMLYLPRGWWHVAYPINQPSLHLTVGVTPLHGLNLLNWLADRMGSAPLLRQNLPVLKGPAEKAAHMANLRAAVSAMLQDDILDAFLRDANYQEHGRPRIRLPHAPYEQRKPLTDDSGIRLASSPVLTFTRQGEDIIFYAYGISYTVPAALEPPLAALSDAATRSLRELKAMTADSVALLSVLDAMARAGVVLVEQV